LGVRRLHKAAPQAGSVDPGILVGGLDALAAILAIRQRFSNLTLRVTPDYGTGKSCGLDWGDSAAARQEPVPSMPILHLEGFDGPMDLLPDLVERQLIDLKKCRSSNLPNNLPR
jgi:hypothetical protein